MKYYRVIYLDSPSSELRKGKWWPVTQHEAEHIAHCMECGVLYDLELLEEDDEN